MRATRVLVPAPATLASAAGSATVRLAGLLASHAVRVAISRHSVFLLHCFFPLFPRENADPSINSFHLVEGNTFGGYPLTICEFQDAQTEFNFCFFLPDAWLRLRRVPLIVCGFLSEKNLDIR